MSSSIEIGNGHFDKLFIEKRAKACSKEKNFIRDGYSDKLYRPKVSKSLLNRGKFYIEMGIPTSFFARK